MPEDEHFRPNPSTNWGENRAKILSPITLPTSHPYAADGGIVGGGTGAVPSNIAIAFGGIVGGGTGAVPSNIAAALGGIVGGGTGAVPSNIATDFGGIVGGGTGAVPSNIATLCCGTTAAFVRTAEPAIPTSDAHNNNPLSFRFIKAPLLCVGPLGLSRTVRSPPKIEL
jgi:hypothetical protein